MKLTTFLQSTDTKCFKIKLNLRNTSRIPSQTTTKKAEAANIKMFKKTFNVFQFSCKINTSTRQAEFFTKYTLLVDTRSVILT